MKSNILLHKDRIRDSLALIAGAILTLAFAPFNLFPIAVLSPAILLWTWLDVTPKKAFWRGWLFGLGFFTTGVYWIFISIHTYGNTSTFLAVFFTVALIAYLALFSGFNGYLLNRYFPKTNAAKLLCAFPAIWVLLEWARSLLLTGFPWLLIGSGQTNSPLKGFAPIVGVYGVSLLVVLSSSLLIFACVAFKKQHFKKMAGSLLGLVFIWGIGAFLNTISWTQKIGDPIQVSLVQGNIAQDLKWSPEHIQPTLQTYENLTNQHWDSKIIIWPESAVPLPFMSALEFLLKIDKQAKLHHSTVITGIPMQIPNTQDYLNAVVTLGEGSGIYAKHRLVPFGEYVPFRRYFGRFMEFMHIPMSDFIAGKDMPEPITVNGIKMATYVCYEIAYPELVLSRDGKTNLILTVSNDAWFDQSIAQAQHVQMAQMRAIETGRPVLFVSNNGITATINAKGLILKSAAPYVEEVVTDIVQPMQGRTPWQKYGMDPMLALLIGLLIFAGFKRQTDL